MNLAIPRRGTAMTEFKRMQKHVSGRLFWIPMLSVWIRLWYGLWDEEMNVQLVHVQVYGPEMQVAK